VDERGFHALFGDFMPLGGFLKTFHGMFLLLFQGCSVVASLWISMLEKNPGMVRGLGLQPSGG
jgi:hypothetical protein